MNSGHKMTLLKEKDGQYSSRRFLACAAFGNAIGLSWRNGTDWQIVLIWIGAGLILLGLTTMQDLKEIASAVKES